LKLYHYTFEKYFNSILKSGLHPSIRIEEVPSSDAQHGDGQYFTDLPPALVEDFTRAQVSQALYKIPRKWGLTGRLQTIVYIEFELEPSSVKRVHDLFPSVIAKTYPEYGIWLYPNTQNLSPDTIIVSGTITFQPMASGNQ
jgi:ADP-ribosyltransferase of polymorphic toxin system